MKKILLFLMLYLSLPQYIQAQTLIVSDDKGLVLETLVFDQFALDTTSGFFIDTFLLEQVTKRIQEQVYEEAKNAYFNEQNEIMPGTAGQRLDTDLFLLKFKEHFYTKKENQLKVPLKVVYPKVDVEFLAEISEKQLASYTTYYNESNKERSHNIVLATMAINNHVLFPGEEFSFNKIVGERTKDRGYKQAPVIVRGELSEGIGGGICQVSSTLFNAVNLKGIQIIERYSHSREVPYVPPGKDATVSWWGPDFVFKNNYKQPILIRARAANGQMSIQIYSPA
ncbi:MAG TPA: VanW family protein [Cerasibacillus sp.]|uniref:VanW family protein n=1 Tax=Cerasibacillus sp. TaxID=2498711 RepID=UPI002F42B369